MRPGPAQVAERRHRDRVVAPCAQRRGGLLGVGDDGSRTAVAHQRGLTRQVGGEHRHRAPQVLVHLARQGVAEGGRVLEQQHPHPRTGGDLPGGPRREPAVQPDPLGEVVLREQPLEPLAVGGADRPDEVERPARRLPDRLDHGEQTPARAQVAHVDRPRARVPRGLPHGEQPGVGEVAQHPAAPRCERRQVVVGDRGEVGPGAGPDREGGDRLRRAPCSGAEPRAVAQEAQVVLVDVGDQDPAPTGAPPQPRADRELGVEGDHHAAARAPRQRQCTHGAGRQGATRPGADAGAVRGVLGCAQAEHLDLRAGALERADLAVQAGVGDVVPRGEDRHQDRLARHRVRGPRG